MSRKKEIEGEGKQRDPGTGALCPEAQADGVPCTELGRDCEICERALEWLSNESEAEDKEAW
jgi:hypothetical protein